MNKRTLLLFFTGLLVSLTGCTHSRTVDPASLDSGISAEQAVSIGNRYLGVGELDRALFYYLQAVRMNLDDPEIYFRIAYAYERQGNLEAADRAYQHVLSRVSGHAGALEGRGIIRLKKHDYEAAQDYLTRAVAADPTRIKSHNGLGVIADIRSNHTVAVAHYQTALSVVPDSVRTLTNLGYSHYLAGLWQEAEQIFQNALQLEPENALAKRNLGLLYARQGHYNKAIGLLRGTMTMADAYNDIGHALMLDRKHQTAAGFLSEAIRLSPTYHEAANRNLRLNRRLEAQRLAAFEETHSAESTATVAHAGHMQENSNIRNRRPNDVGIYRNPPTQVSAGVEAPERQSDVSDAPKNRPLTYLKRFVSATVLRVREQAGLQASILDRVSRGRVVRVLRQDDDWVYVKYWRIDEEGATRERTGWVDSRYLSANRFLQDS